MELKDRIAAVRKAAGLTQEQLGELLGVTRQAVSRWESGQTTPDAATLAALCERLHVSADYVLLGKEPEEEQSAAPAYELPDTCPCCGRKVSGTICPACGYQLPNFPPRGARYAVVASQPAYVEEPGMAAQLEKFCGFGQTEAAELVARFVKDRAGIVLRRGLDDVAAQYIAAHLDHAFFSPCIVEDGGEEDDALLAKPKALSTPPAATPQDNGIGFWGVVLAVIVALLILSFF